ncbi:MAG: acyl-CoA dehydrogenase family protein [Rhodothermales bacterium]
MKPTTFNAAAPPSNARCKPVDFADFLETYRAKLRHIFHVRTDIDKLSLRRLLPPFVMRQIRSCDPLSVYIPTPYGGRGGHIHEGLAVLAASSYESLALSLAFGINWALFLQPVAKYAQEDIKAPIFKRFLKDKHMGGLMITEPDYGSDALNMQTSYVEVDGRYHLQGVKHWGGLTGWADYWLLTARGRGEDGGLKRDIDFFICDVNGPDQEIVVEEYFNNLGLYLIPYGRNRIDVKIPRAQRLQPLTTGIKMMLDLLHRSRMQFPGMGMGYLKRILDEALAHCKKRFVGGRSLFNYDQVQQRLAKIQAWFTVCSAMCSYSSEHATTDRDLSRNGLEANAIKSVVTDFMQEAAQSLLQLVGAKGYRLDHFAGRATVDSRPFQIFEGSNDILYQQITEAFLKLMRRAKEKNLFRFLNNHELTARASDHFKELLNFEVDWQLPQRKLVELGRALGRIISMELVLKLGDRGFHSDLITNGLAMLRQDVTSLLSSYKTDIRTLAVDSYEEGSSWLDFVPKEAF